MTVLVCDVCDLEFASSGGLLGHVILLHTGLELKIVATSNKVAILPIDSEKFDAESEETPENHDFATKILQEDEPEDLSDDDLDLEINPKSKKNPKQTGFRRVFSSSKSTEFKCIRCFKVFQNRREILDHVKFDHAAKNRDKCDKLWKHVKSSPVEYRNPRRKSLTCHQCRLYFKNKAEMNDHMTQTHFEDPDKQEVQKIRCDNCDQTFWQLENYLRHTEEHHSIIENISMDEDENSLEF